MKSKVKLTLVFVILITMFFSNAVYLNAKESMLETRTIGDIVKNYQKIHFVIKFLFPMATKLNQNLKLHMLQGN